MVKDAVVERPRRVKAQEPDKARLAEMIEEATVDCLDEADQAMGLHSMLETNLDLPFETTILGVRVTVEKLDLTRRNQVVALCRRGAERQRIALLDLPLPSVRPKGAEWIEAYRQWVGEG